MATKFAKQSKMAAKVEELKAAMPPGTAVNYWAWGRDEVASRGYVIAFDVLGGHTVVCWLRTDSGALRAIAASHIEKV